MIGLRSTQKSSSCIRRKRSGRNRCQLREKTDFDDPEIHRLMIIAGIKKIELPGSEARTIVGLLVVAICRLVIGSLNQPTFDDSPDNVTSIEGHNVVLRCSISRLGQYKVVWLDQRGFALTYETLRVIDDLRFAVYRPFTKEWNLLISDVKEEDTGQYTCTVNTVPIRSKTIELLVKVPPRFDDSRSSSYVTTSEGASVVLECHVYGVPRPEVTWYRRLLTGKMTQYAVENLGSAGDRFHIQNVTRYCSHVYFVYECHANNGVSPIARRDIRISVEYRPQAIVTNSTIGQKLGHDVIVECRVNAFPLDECFWERRGKVIDPNRVKYSISFDREDDFRFTTSLTISNLDPDDVGEYHCVALNKRGRSEATATVYVAMEEFGSDVKQTLVHRVQPTTKMAIIVDGIKTMEKISQGMIRRRTDDRSSRKKNSSTKILLSTSLQIYASLFSMLIQLRPVITAHL